jgi:hypothetical protein
MGKSTLHLARYVLELVCHLCKTFVKVEGKIQRTSPCEMIHELEVVEHYYAISAFTRCVYLDGFEQMFPLLFQVGYMDILFQSDTFVFGFEIIPKLNVFDSG